MLSVNCKNCVYWNRDLQKAVGLCQRYPETYIKYESDWCGEFQSAEQLEHSQNLGPFDTNPVKPPDPITPGVDTGAVLSQL